MFPDTWVKTELARELPFQPHILCRGAAPCTRAQKELQSFDSVAAKPENPSAFHSHPVSLHGGRGKILFSANGGENSTVNSKCSLKMGCTGGPKAPLLFCIHLTYPFWGDMSSCAQVSIAILSFMLQEVWGSGSSTRCSSEPVKSPLVSELCLYRVTEHCNILSVCIHPWYLLVKLMATRDPLP